ncbi:MAG: fibronectin type III domain-containing protein [Phycisphaerales bacterium]|nr:fibronectin type III domain-containing protein [Phycisphaerales bacterium]
MKSKKVLIQGLLAAAAMGTSAYAQPDTVWTTGQHHYVLFNGANTNLGLSSGNIAATLPQRWYAMPMRVADGNPTTTVTVTDHELFYPAADRPATLEYILWARAGDPATNPPTTIVLQGSLGAASDPLADVVRNEGLSIGPIANGDYYWTMYGAGLGIGNSTGFSNAAWFCGADGQAEDLERDAGWRSATFPTPGFLTYAPANLACPTDGSMPDCEDRWNTSFTLWRQLPPPPPPPTNDTCAAAILIDPFAGSTVVDGTSIGATFESETLNSCEPLHTTGRGVWYQFVGTGSSYEITMCGLAEFNARISVYTGDCDGVVEQVCAAGNDDGCEVAPTTGDPIVQFCSAADTTYYILIDGVGTVSQGTGPFQFVMQDLGACTPPAAPANDLCANAEAITGPLPQTVSGTVAGSTTDVGAPNCLGTVASEVEAGGVWYTVIGTGNTMTASMCAPVPTDPHFDSKISVYTGSCGDLSSLNCVAANDDFCAAGNYSEATFCSTAGVTYRILVHQFFGTTEQPGNVPTFNLTISDVPAPTLPGDDISNAISLPCNGSATVDNTTATNSVCDPVPSCHLGLPGITGTASMWFTFVPSDSVATITTDPLTGATDSVLAVYSGSPGNLTEIGCSDDISGSNFASTVSLTGLTPNTTYYVQLRAWAAGAEGSYTLTTTCGSPQNDCNGNSLGDSDEITNNPALDCFDQAAAPVGGFDTKGGPNGVLDACECAGDWNRNGVVGSSDITGFLGSWFNDLSTAQLKADFDCSGVTGSADITSFLNRWFQNLAGNPPFSGCGL